MRGFVQVLSAALWATTAYLSAQTLQTGPHFYAVKNLETGAIEQRGTAGSNGVAFTALALAPDTSYTLLILQAATLHVGEHRLFTPGPGEEVELPAIILRRSLAGDRDGDGLHDQAEEILGTRADLADTDGDGVADGPEVAAGTDPLDGLPARTGIVGSTDTPGAALDVCAARDMAIVADSTGVMVFNIFNGMEPIVVAQVDTPGTAQAVACAGLRVPVADGASGLAIIDVRRPSQAQVVHQTFVGGQARAVATDGLTAYVGNERGGVVGVDLISGTRFFTRDLGSRPVEDLFIAGDHLYALTDERLVVFDLLRREPFVLASLALDTSHSAPSRMRLAVFDGVGYAVSNSRYITLDVSDPQRPQVLANQTSGQFGWRHLALTGGTVALAAVGPNAATASEDQAALYNVSDPGVNDAFLGSFPTPGAAAAVAVYNGLGYVADRSEGLQVINFLAADTRDTPPEISLSHNLPDNRAIEGQRLRITAKVTDDVQVRQVEFFLNGTPIGSDGNPPYEIFLTAPTDIESASFVLGAQATDTGGNVAEATDRIVNLHPDTAPPEVAGSRPPDGGVVGLLEIFDVFFFEDLAPDSVTPAAFSLTHLGADRLAGTGDDVLVTLASAAYDPSSARVRVVPAATLEAGYYRAAVQAPLSDARGNMLSAPRFFRFHVLGLPDGDRDGIPDASEALVGADPALNDSDGNGIPDGEEDADADGLANAAELALGTAPHNPDTDGDGILDGREDRESDGLPDGREFELASSPFEPDTDSDGWPDAVEAAIGTSSLIDERSVPRLLLPGATEIHATLLGIPPFGRKAGSATSEPVTVEFQ